MKPAHLRRALGVLAMTLGFAATGCEPPPPPEPGATEGEVAGRGSAAPTDARYLTHLLFASADGVAFSGAFDQTAQSGQLSRAYEAWVSQTDDWTRLVRMRDTLPVPRAAWRVLPADAMTVRVGDAGQIVSLGFEPDGADPVTLLVGEEIAVWTGPTGQRESLGLAVLESEDATPGVLFFRRAARALGIQSSGEDTRTFVLADSLGNGLVIHEGTLQMPATARTWLHGDDSAWGDVMVVPADSSATPTRWRFEIPGTDLAGDVRAVSGSTQFSNAVLRLEADLSAGGESFRFSGLTAVLPFP